MIDGLIENRRRVKSQVRCELINAMRRRGVDCKFIARRIRRQVRTVRARIYGIDDIEIRDMAEFALALDGKWDFRTIKWSATAEASDEHML